MPDPLSPELQAALQTAIASALQPLDTRITALANQLHLNPLPSVITLKTAHGLTFTMDDATSTITLSDPAGNKLTLSPTGIAIASQTNLTAQAATGNVAISSPVGNVSLSSPAGNVNATGINIHLAAGIAFSASGSTAAELSSTAQTTVKGALVLIN